MRDSGRTDISEELQLAENHIAIAMSRLGKLGPGGFGAWAGAWGEFKKIGSLLAKTQALRLRIRERERVGFRGVK